MFTDIAGYTESMSKSESKSLDTLEKKRSILKPLLKEYKGTFVKEMGDGTLSYFESAVNAATCAVKLQETTYDDSDMNIRVGIHIGDIVFKDGDVFGGGVNVASRLESIAPAGGVCVSKSVYDELSNQDDFDGIELGLQSLKGVGRLVEVFGLKGDKLSEPNPTEYQENKVAVHTDDEVPSIAIIPFRNKGKEEDTFFAYGICEDLIGDVASAGLIRVASKQQIEDAGKLPIDELAKKLDVRYMTNGELWRMGDMFQLSVELYDSKDKKVIWSDRWQESWDNLSTIKGNLSDGLLKTLDTASKVGKKIETTSAEAYEYYLRGKHKYWKRNNSNDIDIARGLLEKAIELDNNLIIGKHLFGVTYHNAGEYDKALHLYITTLKQVEKMDDKYWIGRLIRDIGEIYGHKGEIDLSIEYYNRSCKIFEELDDKVEMGYSIHHIGMYYFDKGDFEKTMDYYLKALKIFKELENQRATSMMNQNIANVLFRQGKLDKSLQVYNQALQIYEGLDSKPGIASSCHKLGCVYSEKGDYDKAFYYYNKSLQIFEELADNPNIGNVLTGIGYEFFQKGDYDKALGYYERTLKIRELIGDKFDLGNILFHIGRVYSAKGEYDKGLDYTIRSNKMAQNIDDEYGLGFSFNLIGETYRNLGDYKKSAEVLEKCFALRQKIGNKELQIITLINLYLTYKIIGGKYDKGTIINLYREIDNTDTIREQKFNYYLYIILEDISKLEIAYNRIQEKAANLEPDVAAKFLSYPIPKAIVEEWEKVK